MVEKRMMKNCAICGKPIKEVGKIRRVTFGFQTIKVCKKCMEKINRMKFERVYGSGKKWPSALLARKK
jgi:ribosome-binding protein aMBF1 (putative translation factor)